MEPADSPLYWRALSLPKRGNSDSENEDAWSADADAGRFALADGASESAFAGLWARLLAEGFTAARRPTDLARWLARARRRWSEEVTDLKLPWYAEMKRDEGAFATLLGLTVRPPTAERPGRWQAVAVGDTCLINVRDGQLIKAFPVRESSHFDSQPELIGSHDGLAPVLKRAVGSLLPGDRLFLMSDALAQWFLRDQEGGGSPWDAAAPLLTIADPEEDFAIWVEELRSSDGLRDDDVTLLIIAAGSASEE
jgi:serine/threonine protein phosphatase PrpC